MCSVQGSRPYLGMDLMWDSVSGFVDDVIRQKHLMNPFSRATDAVRKFLAEAEVRSKRPLDSLSPAEQIQRFYDAFNSVEIPDR